MEDGWILTLLTSQLLFPTIHIPTDMLKAHKNERCHDCILAWLCPFKKGAVLLVEEGFLLPGNTSFCKEQEEVCQKKKVIFKMQHWCQE